MQLFRHIITVACVVMPLLASAGEQRIATSKGAAGQPIAAELRPLQGAWEGFMVGDTARQKVIITITGDSLHFHRDTNFWFETTFALPAGKNPKQLHATIKGCPRSQADSIGKVVRTLFKIEDGTLTLATLGDGADETSSGFESAGNRYELRKVEPQGKNTQPPGTQ